jgi:hypothetical protein
MDILIGADPELFVRDKTGKYVSAHGLVSGTKKNPLPVEHGAVQVDGMALEFNINPAKNAEEFTGRIQAVLASLNSMIPGHLTFAFDPVADFGKELIDKQPDEAKELGCDPDFNAYMDGAPNPRPDANTDFRTASGHIHIGWTNGEDVTNPDHLEACMMVTKQLDCVLGITEFVWCEPNKRKELYGKLGTFRPKHYGVEYRVLSNAWLRSDKLQKLVYTVAHNAVSDLYNGRKYYSDASNWVDSIQSADNPWAWWVNRVKPIASNIWGRTGNLRSVISDIENNVFNNKPRTVFLK